VKILWFTITPCGASEKLKVGSQGGGWLSALEKSLVSSGKVELHVCFQCETDIPSFSCGGVTYHPTNRVRLKNRLLGHFLGRGFKSNPILTYIDIISRVKPDLIHVHGTEEDFGLIQSVTDRPVVISMQGILTNYISKYFSGISFARLLVSEGFFSHLYFKSVLSNYFIFRANAKRERLILDYAKHVIGRTAWDRRSTAVLAPKAYYYHVDEILRDPFYDGVWSRQEFSTPVNIVSVLGIAPYKGYEMVLNVARILRDQTGMNFTWFVAGLSPKDSLVSIMDNWLGAQGNVKLLGTLSGKEIRDLLLNSDIFCQVSHIENSPNSLCEAMLLGMPIVASFAGGTDSMLCAGEEGILVQDGDPLSLAGAILELCRDTEGAARMGHAARTRAQSRHNADNIVKDLLSVYSLVSKVVYFP